MCVLGITFFVALRTHILRLGLDDQMNIDRNDTSIPISNTMSALHRLTVHGLCEVTLGINSRPNMAMLTKCWASVVNSVPALKQRWLHVIVQRYACLLGLSFPEAYTTTLS